MTADEPQSHTPSDGGLDLPDRGSAPLAAFLTFAGRPQGASVPMAAGLILAGYVGVEAAILKQNPPGPTLIEGFYFGLGLIVFGLAAYLVWSELGPRRR